ncbi:ABC transporter ATP-binding protein [Paradesulfitobacterium ferrireducens]|uniref:ABC transporter ATP-binding protein n=1 Tax=Paradesulfitobacterium ferrireducens TaxID=2816476 RepID=UPI001A8CFA72|nr:ABC transporter ATP-binding protein [Paradesulfitobacterium ferrireducens]
MSEALIAAKQISVRFGGLWAIKDVELQVNSGEILGIIGPNGAGKSTFLNVLSGLQRPSAGHLVIGKEETADPKAWRMAKLGIARSFQTIRLIDDMSVLENVLIGTHLYAVKGFLQVVGRSRSWHQTERQLKEGALETLAWLGVGHKAELPVSMLPLQERRRVEIARALMIRPRVLLLDEPCAGLSQQESLALSNLMSGIRTRGVSIVLVEHNVKLVMALADRVVVLDHGQKIAEGTPTEVAHNETVIQAYLGGEVHA